MQMLHQRPKYDQRACFKEHKKCQTIDFHFVHSGNDRVFSLIDPNPGTNDAVSTAKKSLAYSNHVVFADLAQHLIGDQFLCRIAQQNHAN